MKLIAILISIIFFWDNSIGCLPSQGLPIYDALRPQATSSPFASIEDLIKLNENIILPLDIFSRMIYPEFYPSVCHTTALATARYISRKTGWPFYHNIVTLLKHEIGVSCLPLDVGPITHIVTAVKFYDEVLLIDNISNWRDDNTVRNAYITMTKEQILDGCKVSFGAQNYHTFFSLCRLKGEETVRREHDALFKLTKGGGLTEKHYLKDRWLLYPFIEWVESPTTLRTAGDIVRRIIAVNGQEMRINHRLVVNHDLTEDGELVIDGIRREAKWFLHDISVSDFLDKLPEDRLLKLILIVHRLLIEISYGTSHSNQIDQLREYIASENLDFSAEDIFEYTERKRKSVIGGYDKGYYVRKIGNVVDNRIRGMDTDADLVNILHLYSWIAFDLLKWAIFSGDKESEENLTKFLKLKHRINEWLNRRDSGFYGVSLKASETIASNIDRVHEQASYLHRHCNITEPGKVSSAGVAIKDTVVSQIEEDLRGTEDAIVESPEVPQATIPTLQYNLDFIIQSAA